jgi:hypothetical protein
MRFKAFLQPANERHERNSLTTKHKFTEQLVNGEFCDARGRPADKLRDGDDEG